MSNTEKHLHYEWLLANCGRVWTLGDECLIWPFGRDTKGYGQCWHDGKIRRAHRLMCQLVNGPPPTEKHQAGHDCGNGSGGCVDPRHLKWKTNAENQKDKRLHGVHFNGGYGRYGKLTKQQVAEIQALKGVVTIVELANRYGVKRGTIDRWHRIARDGYDFNSVGNRRNSRLASSD